MSINATGAIYGLMTSMKSNDYAAKAAMSEQTTLFDYVNELATDIDKVEVGTEDGDKVGNKYNEIEALSAEYNDLKAEISKLNEVITKAKEEKEAAQKEIARLTMEIAQTQVLLNAEILDKQNNVEAKQKEEAEKKENEEKLESEKLNNESVKAQLQSSQEEAAEIANKIQAAKANFENGQANKKNQIMAQCQADYDEEKDGDYNAYVQKRLDAEMGSATMSDSVSGLEGQRASITAKTSSLKSALAESTAMIASIQNEIADNNSNISNYESAISKNESNMANYSAKITDLNNKVSDQKAVIDNANVLIAYSQETIDNNSSRMEEIEKENPQKTGEMRDIVAEDMSEEDFAMISKATKIDFADNKTEGISALKTLAEKENLVNAETNDNVLDEKDISYLNSKYNLSSVPQKEKVAETSVVEFFA